MPSPRTASESQAYRTLRGRCIDNGRLELLNVLGSGSYGVVYRALDVQSPPSAPVHYAVKCLFKNGNPRRLRFQRREIELHRKASTHPNVVTLHSAIEDENWFYLVMDYGSEGDLFNMITDRKRYLGNDQLVKDIFIQILDALQHCHNVGVYHRDLKPENILCFEGGSQVKIADFGLATSERSSGEFGCGSGFYMSPECRNERGPKYLPAQNDIWALGVILINLACGRNPWQIASPRDETYRAYLLDANILRVILPIPREVNKLLDRIFTTNPYERITIAKLTVEVTKMSRFTISKEALVEWNAMACAPLPLPISPEGTIVNDSAIDFGAPLDRAKPHGGGGDMSARDAALFNHSISEVPRVAATPPGVEPGLWTSPRIGTSPRILDVTPHLQEAIASVGLGVGLKLLAAGLRKDDIRPLTAITSPKQEKHFFRGVMSKVRLSRRLSQAK